MKRNFTINILILSAGRRKSLVGTITETLKKKEIQYQVFVADANPQLSAVCMDMDQYITLPHVREKQYKEALIQVIREKEINIVIPTIDTELQVLSELKNHVFGHKFFPIISDFEFTSIFHLKTTTEAFFLKHGFLTPKINVSPTKEDLPLFAKLDASSSSVGAQKVLTSHQLDYLKKSDQDYVFQELIEGDEYTVDFFMSKDHKPLAIVPRKRLEVRGGEVSKALTVYDEGVIQEVERMASVITGAYGPMCVQVIKNENGIYFIEINTRFGGGYPLTYKAGAFNFVTLSGLICIFLGIINAMYRKQLKLNV